MYGQSPDLKDQADSDRHGYAMAIDVMAEQHIDSNMHDPMFIDQSLSDYCFLSANKERESEYRQALFQIYHNHDSSLMIQLISKAMLEKSRKEVSDYVRPPMRIPA